MTSTDHTASLHTIGDDKLMTSNPDEDVRGRSVLDKSGADIGHVDDLLIDDREHKVRFLRVAFWVSGRRSSLSPSTRLRKWTATQCT